VYQLLDAWTPTQLGIQNNRWLFYHCLWGALFAKLLNRAGVKRKYILTAVLVGAVLYEVGQFVYQVNTGGILSHNASWTHWWWDSFFDIVGAVLFARLSV